MGIINLLSILLEYPIKERGSKFPRFLCFWGVLFASIYQQKLKIKNNVKHKNKEIKLPRFPTFRLWPIPEIENYRNIRNIRKFSFTLIFGSIRNSKSKNQKNDFKQKI